MRDGKEIRVTLGAADISKLGNVAGAASPGNLSGLTKPFVTVLPYADLSTAA